MNTQRNVKTNRRELFRRCNIGNYELSRISKIHHEKLERLKIFYQKKVEAELENSTIMKDNLSFSYFFFTNYQFLHL